MARCGGAVKPLLERGVRAVPPVRGVPVVSGQRNRPGLWWFASAGGHVGHESWLEWDRLMALDADPGVVAVAAQPMWLDWADFASGRALRHAPDCFARRADGRVSWNLAGPIPLQCRSVPVHPVPGLVTSLRWG